MTVSFISKRVFVPVADYRFRYFYNKDDQIRSIEHPDQEFNYFISKNERVCDVQREAMNSNSFSIPFSNLTDI